MNIFKEKYDPWVTHSDELMQKEIRVGKLPIVLIGVTTAIIVCSVVFYVGLLGALVLPIAITAFAWEERYPLTLINHNRRDIGTIYDYCVGGNSWYSKETAKDHPVYKERLMEYLDYLRAGGERSDLVEADLGEWLREATRDLTIQENNRDKEIASMFNNQELLEAYRKAKKTL